MIYFYITSLTISSSFTIRVICLVVVLLAVFSQTEAGWWRRRRRCGCNNKWFGWSAWSACSHKCGGSGVRERSRSPDKNCCGDPPVQSDSCSRWCYDGHLSDGNCVCDLNYSGECCENYVRYYYLHMMKLQNS